MDERQKTPAAAPKPAVGPEQLKKWTDLLRKYQTAKSPLDKRVTASEEWWKLRNAERAVAEGAAADAPGQFRSASGWLHNVIVSKHADAMDSFPTPNVLPRESGDQAEATILSSVIPAVLEQNHFEKTYSEVTWQKLKTGTGVYKITWDHNKLHGLGDISIRRVNILNLFWEPNVTDIQDSKAVFHIEMQDRETLETVYPELRGKLKSANTGALKRFRDEDRSMDTDKETVIEIYYKRLQSGRAVLHYCKFVGDTVLYSTENETKPLQEGQPSMAERGLYDHGLFPFVFDSLFPVEGSPCGYGYVDLCRNPQTEIDLLKTSFLQNAMVGAKPRYFIREDGEIDEKELLDLTRPTVRVSGNMGQDSLRVIDYKPLDSSYSNYLQQVIMELRETSGNTETATGSSHGGATAASAIAALQEAAGKGSRDSTQASYRAFSELVELVIELIRQFYDLPRQFRIVGEYGAQRFVNYSNAGIKPQSLLADGYRLPVFDIRVEPQRKSAYTQMSQNELALQFYHEGFFRPDMTDQALSCLEMMEFDGKDAIVQMISRNGTMAQKLILWQQLALELTRRYEPQNLQALAQSVETGGGAPAGGGGRASLPKPELMDDSDEAANVRNARAQSQDASRPGGKGVTVR